MEWVSERLTFVMKDNEKNPRKAEEEDEAIKSKKGQETGFLISFGRLIKPENLREGDKKNGAVTGMKENGRYEGSKENVSLPVGLEVFYQEVYPCHSEKHNQGIRTSVLGEANMVGHKG